MKEHTQGKRDFTFERPDFTSSLPPPAHGAVSLLFVIRTKAENGAASEYLTRRSQMNDFGVWTKMTPRPLPALHRSFVFINDGGKKKKEKEGGRAAGSTDVLHCGG